MSFLFSMSGGVDPRDKPDYDLKIAEIELRKVQDVTQIQRQKIRLQDLVANPEIDAKEKQDYQNQIKAYDVQMAETIKKYEDQKKSLLQYYTDLFTVRNNEAEKRRKYEAVYGP